MKKSNIKNNKPIELPKAKASKKPTLAEMQKCREDNLKHIGYSCSFIPMTGEEPIAGAIKGLMADKRVCLVYFRIADANGRIYHKRVDSSEIVISDQLAPETAESIARKEKAEKAKIAKIADQIKKTEARLAKLKDALK